MTSRTLRIGHITDLQSAIVAIRDIQRSLGMVARDDVALVEVVDTLPDPDYGPPLVLLGDTIYRKAAEGYISAVLAGDITGQIVSSQIADAAINTAHFAQGIEPVAVLGQLPIASPTSPSVVFLTTDRKLYRKNATNNGYTVAVPTADLSGEILGSQIANAAITTAKFAAGIEPVAVVGALPSAVGGPSLVYLTTDGNLYRNDGAAYTAEVAANLIAGQIIAGQIAAGAIGSDQIAANAVTTGKIFAGAVTALKIAALAIETDHLAAGAVTAAKIAANTITAAQIAADTITAGQIAAGAIGASEIAAGAVITEKLAAGAVTANEIAVLTILAGNIAAGQITTSKIAALAVTAAEIAAGAVIADKIAANAVTATKILAGEIGTGHLAADAVTADKIAANAIANAGNTVGVLFKGALPGGWTRYLNLTAVNAEPFLYHPALSLLANGSATFSGALSAATGTFAGELTAATGTFSGTLNAGTIASGILDMSASNGAYIRWWNGIQALPDPLPMLSVKSGQFLTDVFDLRITAGKAQIRFAILEIDQGIRTNSVTPPGGTFNVAGNFTVNGSPLAPGGVTSVYGRTGAVVAVAGDYSFAQLSGTASVAQGGTGLTAIAANRVLVGNSGGTAMAQAAINSTATAMYLRQAASGVPAFAQVAFSELSGTATAVQIPSLDTSKIGSGVFARARLGTGTSNEFTWLRGDGTWNPLPADLVTSVFGRVGAVVAAANDYTFAQIGSKPTTLEGYGITGGTLTSALTLTNYLNINGAAGSYRQISFNTGGVTRWVAATNSAAEGGSNTGSDFDLYRYSDAGAYLGTALSIYRSTGHAAFGASLSVPSAQRIYLDNGSNTYIVENAADSIQLVRGGTAALTLDSAGATFPGPVSAAGTITASSGIYLLAGQKLYSHADLVNYYLNWTAGGRLDMKGYYGVDVRVADGLALNIESTRAATFASSLTVGGVLVGNAAARFAYMIGDATYGHRFNNNADTINILTLTNAGSASVYGALSAGSTITAAGSGQFGGGGIDNVGGVVLYLAATGYPSSYRHHVQLSTSSTTVYNWLAFHLNNGVNVTGEYFRIHTSGVTVSSGNLYVNTIVPRSGTTVFVDGTLDADALKQNGNAIAAVLFTTSAPTSGSTSTEPPGTLIVVVPA